jgi:hypothetical protein
MTLPSHASRELCNRERERWRLDLPYQKTSLCEVIEWLLDECDMLEREYDAMRRECEAWHQKALRTEP